MCTPVVSPAVSAIAYVDPAGTVLAGNSEWRAMMKRSFPAAEPPVGYADIWDNLSNGASGVANQLRRCLDRCHKSDQPSQVVVSFWRTSEEFYSWHITMQRGQSHDPNAEIMVFHSDLAPWAAKELQSDWANDLTELLIQRQDMVVFEHDLEGVFKRFEGGESLLGCSPEERQNMRLDRVVAPQCLNFVIEMVLSMQDRPGWTAVYESEWIGAGRSTKKVRVTNRIASDGTRSLAVRGIAQILSD